MHIYFYNVYILCTCVLNIYISMYVIYVDRKYTLYVCITIYNALNLYVIQGKYIL